MKAHRTVGSLSLLLVAATVGCVAADGTIGEPADDPQLGESSAPLTQALGAPATRELTVCQSYRSAEWSHGTSNQGWPFDIGLSSYCPGNEAAGVALVALADGWVAHLRPTPASQADDHMYLRVNNGSGGQEGLVMYGHVIPTSSMYEGKPVKKGEVIATIRPAGWTNGNQAHLHLEIYAGNCWMCSPQPFTGAFRLGSNDFPGVTTSNYYRGYKIKPDTAVGGATFNRAISIAGHCVDAAGTNTGAGNGAKIQIYDCKTDPQVNSQHFVIDSARRLRNDNGRCIDVAGGSTADGADLVNWDCHTGTNQQWTFPVMNIVSASTGNCVDFTGGDSTKGIQFWDCQAPERGVKWGHANQLWSYDPVSDEIKIAGKCLEVPGNSITNGTQLKVATCGGYARQKWYPYNGGFRNGLASQTSYKCMDVRGGGTANGTALQIWDCSAGHRNQKFALRGPIKSVASSRCMDLTSGSVTNGNQLQQWACTVGHPNQIFTMWMP